jgi:hypothetical protein
MDARVILDHQFLVAAYVATWTIQLAYLLRLALKWRAEKRAAKTHEGRRR